ncbi:MAG: hypothetical protein EAZ55_11045 [Cytophagales bacterium]|nr:MAG: hypothetical protein EAZ55_11045 [Cytophagales bacterium]
MQQSLIHTTKIKLLFSVALAVVMYTIVYLLSLFSPDGFSIFSVVLFFGLVYMIWELSSHQVMPKRASGKNAKYPYLIIIFQYLRLLVIVLFITNTTYAILKTYLILYANERDTVSIFHLLVVTCYTTLMTTIVFSIQIGIAFFEKWQLQTLSFEKFKQETIKTQLEGLKQQLSPHFLFNSLNILLELIDENPTTAKKYINHLAEIYRYVLKQGNEEIVTVTEEIKFVQSYYYLLKHRFTTGLELTINIAPEIANHYYVLPLAIQTLIENAVKHNTISTQKPLKISIEAQNNHLVISNNLQKRIESNLQQKSAQIGLNNLMTRYEYLSSEKITINQNKQLFQVTIPLLKIEDEIS